MQNDNFLSTNWQVLSAKKTFASSFGIRNYQDSNRRNSLALFYRLDVDYLTESPLNLNPAK